MRLIKNLSLILAITAMLFMAVDLVISVFNPLQQLRLDLFQTEGGVLRVRNHLYHHGLAPDIRVMAGWGKLRYLACTDENAFLVSCDRQSARGQRHFDVAFMGDSFTEGVGYTFENSVPGLYAAAHPELDVANLAVTSYSPSIYMRKIQDLLDRGYSFKHVILLMDISDIEDEALFYEWRGDKVVDKRDPDCALYRTPFTRYFRYTTRFLTPALAALFPFNDSLAAFYDPLMRANWPYMQDNEVVQSGMTKALNTMRRLKALLDERGIALSLTVHPWPANLRRGDPRHLGVTLWEDFCAREGCRDFIDAGAGLFAEAERDGAEAVIARYYMPGDVHFNDKGNLLYFNVLQKAGL